MRHYGKVIKRFRGGWRWQAPGPSWYYAVYRTAYGTARAARARGLR